MKRFDVCTPRPKKDGGTYWHRVGVAFDGDKGITVYLDSAPFPDAEGRVALMLFEPRDNTGRAPRRDEPAGGGRIDDDIPFAAETR